jgi:hypothetical protein
MLCNFCHTENEDVRLFCSHCGKALSSIRHVCGYINKEKDLYCGGCGKELKENREIKLEKIDDIFGEKFSDVDIEELMKEENIPLRQKGGAISQDEIDKVFKKS